MLRQTQIAHPWLPVVISWTSWTGFRLSSTQQPGWSAQLGNQNILHQYWWTSTGCVSKRESSTNSASWCSSASTAWHLRISLSMQLQQVAQLESRQRLRSSSSSAFVVPATRRSTLGGRSFSAAGTRAWNSLPPTVTAASTLSSFRRYLKSHLFTKSFHHDDNFS